MKKKNGKLKQPYMKPNMVFDCDIKKDEKFTIDYVQMGLTRKEKKPDSGNTDRAIGARSKVQVLMSGCKAQ